jgi:hypothetical protein
MWLCPKTTTWGTLQLVSTTGRGEAFGQHLGTKPDADPGACREQQGGDDHRNPLTALGRQVQRGTDPATKSWHCGSSLHYPLAACSENSVPRLR